MPSKSTLRFNGLFKEYDSKSIWDFSYAEVMLQKTSNRSPG
jgi:hypothetical protein